MKLKSIKIYENIYEMINKNIIFREKIKGIKNEIIIAIRVVKL